MTMTDKKPQSFALVLAEADGGLLNQQLSAAWQELHDDLDERSMLHDSVFKGEITIKLKVSNDHGKVEIVPAVVLKKPPTKYTGARFFRTEDGDLTTQDPRVAHDLFAEKARQAKAEKQQAKSAAAPTAAGKAV